jgi:hypothetical protein
MIYLFVLFLFLSLSFVELYCFKKKKILKYTFAISSFSFLALFLLRKETVGGDTVAYVDYYMGRHSLTYGYLYDKQSSIEIGFQGLCKFFSSFIHFDFGLILVTSVISIVPIIFYIKKHSNLPSLSFFYIVCLSYMMLIINLETNLRQVVANGYFIIALLLVENNSHLLKQMVLKKKEKIKCAFLRKYVGKVLLYLTFIFLALCTHNSMFFILPMLLLSWFLPFSKKTAIISIVIAMCISLFAPYVISDSIMKMMKLSIFSRDVFDHANGYLYEESNYSWQDRASLYVIFPIALTTIYSVFVSKEEELKSFNAKCMIMGSIAFIIGVILPLSFRIFFSLMIIGISYVPKKIALKPQVYICNFVLYLWPIYKVVLLVFNQENYYCDNHLLPYLFIWE